MSVINNPDDLDRFENRYVNDVLYTEDINKKMRVPRRIRIGNDHDDNAMINGSGNFRSNLNQEHFDMHVPERIVVGGYDEFDIKDPSSEPEEEPEIIRIATPPKVITLDKYPYPNVNDRMRDQHTTPKTRFDKNMTLLERDNTPAFSGDSLTPAEDIYHLRRQIARLNRRVMALELENMQRRQSDKIMYGIGIAYFLLKAIMWLNHP